MTVGAADVSSRAGRCVQFVVRVWPCCRGCWSSSCAFVLVRGVGSRGGFGYNYQAPRRDVHVQTCTVDGLRPRTLRDRGRGTGTAAGPVRGRRQKPAQSRPEDPHQRRAPAARDGVRGSDRAAGGGRQRSGRTRFSSRPSTPSSRSFWSNRCRPRSMSRSSSRCGPRGAHRRRSSWARSRSGPSRCPPSSSTHCCRPSTTRTRRSASRRSTRSA